MIKLIDPDSYDFGEPVAQLVDVCRNGHIDGDWAVKRAAAGVFKNLDIEPRPGHQLIHLIGMGDSEVFGQNRNGDAFPGYPRSLTFPEGDWDTCFTKSGEIHRKGPDTYADKVEYGSNTQAKTFESGHVYRDHRNRPDKGDPIHGEVRKSIHNPSMRRVEIMVEVPENATWRDDLESISKDIPIPWSMSCVTDPAYPVLTQRGYKAIADIVPGDMVLTHQGRWRKVTELRRRKYTGKLVKLHFNGLPVPLEMTADHLLFGTVFSGGAGLAPSIQAKRYFASSESFDANPPGWIHAEHFQEGDRVMYQPVPRMSGFAGLACLDLAKLLGYYVAEGSFTRNAGLPSAVSYSCHCNDSLPRVVPEIVARLWPDVTCSITVRTHSKVSLNVNVSSSKLARFCDLIIGANAEKKFIAPELFNAERDIKLAFAGAWLDGDGFVDGKGMHWSSCNLNLILQGRDLLASIGIPASIYHIDHAKCATSGMAKSGQEYTLNVAHLERAHFLPWSAKAAKYPEPIPTADRSKPAALRPCKDGRYAYRIKEVTTREAVDIQTYNFEVEEDASYTLAGIISHNCKIPYDICNCCGHTAAQPSNYCRHMTDMLGEILHNGLTVGCWNEKPEHFDISRVRRPADRVAWSMYRITRTTGSKNEKRASADLAFDPLFYPHAEEVASQPSRFSPKQSALKEKLAEMEKRVAFYPASKLLGKAKTSQDVAKVASHQLPRFWKALGTAAVILPMEKWASAVGLSISSGLLDAARAYLPHIYSTSWRPDSDQVRAYEAYAGQADESFRKQAKALSGDLGLLPEDVMSRTIYASLRNEPTPQLRSKQASSDPQAEAVAREYAMYQLSTLETAAASHPGFEDFLCEQIVLQNVLR